MAHGMHDGWLSVYSEPGGWDGQTTRYCSRLRPPPSGHNSLHGLLVDGSAVIISNTPP